MSVWGSRRHMSLLCVEVKEVYVTWGGRPMISNELSDTSTSAPNLFTF